ncbi:Arylsulfatase [Crateriforma conspicua]|uniref:Arylsulfatase n=2 Tax=Crateriforma conspicua TaxID=2527996 RepID=A0A5C6FHI4_9PLAN|nr:Arylsulfatase [Crateriforma conspicua]
MKKFSTKWTVWFCGWLFPLALLHVLVMQSVSAGDPSRPNIVLIMADDMGFSDIGCYGGEIQTPNIDRLAAGGIRFTQFYNTGRCCPTRASLMTGLYPHEAGLGHMVYRDRGTGYHPYLNRQTVTIAEVLKDAGYRTMMAGKWHVGHEKGQWPTDRGFEHFYGIHIHVDSYFKVLPGCPVYHNDRLVIDATETPPNTLHPDQPWYTTDVFTDWSLKFLDDAANDERPFFLYTAYNSPHWPLEAPDENISECEGRYDEGWDQLRREKLKRMIQMGVVDADTTLPDSQCPAWADLSASDQTESAFRREIYAAQIERMDQNIGRIIEKLDQAGRLDNTLILFLSDNGCCAEGGMFGYRWNENTKGNHDQWRNQSGRSSSMGEAWSNASNTPFRLHKRWVHEGGIATPLIAHWPDGIDQPDRWCRRPGHVVDVLATCVDVAGAKYPTQFDGEAIKPTPGVSLKSAFESVDDSSTDSRPLFWEHESHAAVRQGKWKLVTLNATDVDAWELYDIVRDRTEQNDVAPSHPKVVQRLRDQWTRWATQANVLPWPKDRVEKK